MSDGTDPGQATETINPLEEAQLASSCAVVTSLRAEADRAWDRVARERDRAEALRLQRDELADALEAYVETWEDDGAVILEPPGAYFFAKVTPRDGDLPYYLTKPQWQRREIARAALRKAGRP